MVYGPDKDIVYRAPEPPESLVVLLDQFPRNMFRASAKAFVADRQAQWVAEHIVSRGWDRDLKPAERWFVYLLVAVAIYTAGRSLVAIF